MNFLISITLITLMLNQVICESLNDDTEKQKNYLKFYPKTHSSDYIDLFPSSNSLDYYYCRKVLSTFKPIDSIDSINHDSKIVDRLKEKHSIDDAYKIYDRLIKRHSNSIDDIYKMDNYQEEKRKKDDLKIFRNLFLGSRG